MSSDSMSTRAGSKQMYDLLLDAYNELRELFGSVTGQLAEAKTKNEMLVADLKQSEETLYLTQVMNSNQADEIKKLQSDLKIAQRQLIMEREKNQALEARATHSELVVDILSGGLM